MRFVGFLENDRSIISYDFDGVLHSSLHKGTTHPIDYYDWWDWEPYLKMHKMLRQDALSSTVVVVSARDPGMDTAMWEFIKHYKLPVQSIHLTSDRPKWPILKKLGAIKHYDDSPKVARELQGKPIEFVFVRPQYEV
jgi:hypothetical protein